jgi:YggT family protein
MSYAIGKILFLLLDIAFWIIIIQVVISWLITFEVINIRNPQAANFVRLIDRITAPVFTPLRKIIPPVAGIDLTPIIVIFAIYLLKSLVASIFFM